MIKNQLFGNLMYAFILAGQLTASARAEALPGQFTGTWRVDCDDPDDLFVLQIISNQFRFWETIGDITHIEILSENSINVTLSLFSEDQQWTATMEYQLVNGRLVQQAGTRHELIRKHCDKAPS